MGSSPLARGLRRFRDRDCARPGIIPARAGFTRAARVASPQFPDHPRSRGVYLMGMTQPPRTPWIIPARAGFTAGRPWSSGGAADHPRSRGVYSAPRTWTVVAIGSSPLARGLRLLGRVGERLPRIIPARAGFTRRGRVQPGSRTDHPRSRGVYQRGYAGDLLLTGSSPLARGLRLLGRVGERLPRIIPARAGFTRRGRVQPGSRTDHPRSRGVYDLDQQGNLTNRGSSPLARGLRGGDRAARAGRRIIPARAGFTPS